MPPVTDGDTKLFLVTDEAPVSNEIGLVIVVLNAEETAVKAMLTLSDAQVAALAALLAE